MGQKIFDEVVSVPEADAKELRGPFALDRLLETAPADEEALLRLEILHRADQLIEDDALHRGLGGFDLNANAGFPKTERAGRGKEIHSVIRSRRRLVDCVALRLKNSLNEGGKTMTLEPRQNQAGNLVHRGLLNIDRGDDLIGFYFFRSAAKGSLGVTWNLPAIGSHLLDPFFSVVALDSANGEKGSE